MSAGAVPPPPPPPPPSDDAGDGAQSNSHHRPVSLALSLSTPHQVTYTIAYPETLRVQPTELK